MTAAALRESNERYWQAAQTWLLLLLQRHLDSSDVAAGTTVWRRRFARRQSVPAPSAEALHAARADLTASETADPAPLMMHLREKLRLDPIETDILMLCAAMEFNPRLASLCSRLRGGGSSQPWPTFSLVRILFGEPSWDVFAPHRPLRSWRLIEINQPGATLLSESPFRADEWVVTWLRGFDCVDERLSPFLTPIAGSDWTTLAESQQRVGQVTQDELLKNATVVDGIVVWPVVQLSGPDTSSKLALVRCVAHASGWSLYHLSSEFIPTQIADVETSSGSGTGNAA
jgi:hypothetical protein